MNLELTAPLQLFAGDKKQRKFTGVTNSGQPFRYWGRQMVLDLAGIQHAQSVPILLQHDAQQRAGVGAFSVDRSRGFIVEGHLLSNEHGTAVARDADQGFPWQMSVGITPSRIDNFAAGNSVSVNGRSIPGPVDVLRGSRIGEASFVVLGADSRTTATMLSAGAATQQWRRLLAAKMSAGLSRREAIGALVAAQPALHAQFLREVNSREQKFQPKLPGVIAFQAAVTQALKAGKTRAEAVRHIAHTQPETHQAYLEAVNA